MAVKFALQTLKNITVEKMKHKEIKIGAATKEILDYIQEINDLSSNIADTLAQRYEAEDLERKYLLLGNSLEPIIEFLLEETKQSIAENVTRREISEI